MKTDPLELRITLKKFYLSDHNHSLEIQPFEFTVDSNIPFAAITGPSGAGKTTFCRTFFHHYINSWIEDGCEVQFEKLYSLNGIALNHTKDVVGYAPQRPFFLPNKTIHENLCAPFGWKGKSAPLQSDVEKVCQIFFLDRTINRHISDLSAGELQRLNLARMLLAGPQIAIIDECLTSLDQELASQIVKNLHENYTDHSRFLIVTHRLTDLSYVPHVWVRFALEENSGDPAFFQKSVKVNIRENVKQNNLS
ncbi:MAG: ATP-binding cassette domain-containing protein [Sedimentisphaerales bacterium]